MFAKRYLTRSLAMLIAATMAFGTSIAPVAADTRNLQQTTKLRQVNKAAKVPKHINRPPAAPVIAMKRKDGGGAGRTSTVVGKANDPAHKVPKTLPSADNQLRDRLKEQANRKRDQHKPNTGTSVGSVSGSARAELSSQIKAGVAGSAINTARLKNIEDRIDTGQFRDRVADGASSAMKNRIDGALTSGLRNVGTGLLADNTDVADGIVGGVVAAERQAVMSGLAWGVANGGMNIGVGSLAGASSAAVATSASITGAVGAAAVAGWTVGRVVDRATGVGGALMGAAGEAVGDAMWNADHGPNSTDKPNQGKTTSDGSTTTGGTQTADSTNANGASGSTDQGTGTGNGDANGSSTDSSNGSGTTDNGGQTAADGSGNGGGSTSNGSCGDQSGGATTCSSSSDDGSTPASTDNASSGGDSKGTPNPANETSSQGSILASMALDRMLGGNQTRQQEKDRNARTGGGVTTPYDGAETSNLAGNLALDRQFNTGYASRQEDHIAGKQGGNVGQPGEDVNWNRNRSAKADLDQLNVVKAMQTGIKTPTVDQGNAGNKAPKAPTVGGGFTGGGGGTTADQASSSQGTASVVQGATAVQSVKSALQSRLRNALSSSASQLKDQASTVR